jgi:ribose-phosphate pyrophosphokinase
VIVLEPHSDVTCAVLDRALADNQTGWMLNEVVEEVGFRKDMDYLFFPDAGAQKRYGNVTGFQQIVGYKKRDFATGKITSLDVVGLKESLDGLTVIIVDDLCSYGGTFMMSGNKLKELGADKVYLIVAHAEEAIFKGDLLLSNSPIDKVFTTNTIINDNLGYNDKLKVFVI